MTTTSTMDRHIAFSEWIAETIEDEITIEMDDTDLRVFASQAMEVAESNGDTILEDHAGIVAWLTEWLDAKRNFQAA